MTPDAIVIGAGFAGLSAAVELTRHGARVLVLEARPRLGGRATGFNDPVTGELVDNGQHVLFGCYHETFRFLRTIGAEDHIRLQPHLEVAVVDRSGRQTILRTAALPAPFHLVAGVLEWEALDMRDRLAVLKLLRPLRIARQQLRGQTTARAASPGETVEDWLVLNGQTRRLREMLWEPLALAALNQSPREAAAPPFVRVLAQMFGSETRDAALAIPLKPLHQMYAEPARAFIEAHGGEVRTSAPARLVVEHGRLYGAEAGGDRIPALAAIAAVPWHAIGALFSDAAGLPEDFQAMLGRAARMRSSPIVSVNLWLDRQVLDVPFVGLPGRTMQWVFDKREVFGESASHLALVSSGAAAVAGLENEDLIAIATRELHEALPNTRSARIVRATVVREKQATFSLAPGQPARPSTQTAVEGLYLAGDWIDTGLPGTIESAVISGHIAADAVRHRHSGELWRPMAVTAALGH